MVNFKQLLGKCSYCSMTSGWFKLFPTTEKATNGDLSEPDWEAILEIVEEVKTKNTS